MTAGRVERRRSRGLSLLEALVALAIAAIAFVALYRSVGQSAFNAVTLDERVQARVLARSILASATFADDFIQRPAGSQGQWRWTIQVAPQTLVLAETGGQNERLTVQAAHIELLVSHEGRPVLSQSAWKPYARMP